MINSQDLSNAFAHNVAIIKMQTEGLTHEDSMRQLPHDLPTVILSEAKDLGVRRERSFTDAQDELGWPICLSCR